METALRSTQVMNILMSIATHLTDTGTDSIGYYPDGTTVTFSEGRERPRLEITEDVLIYIISLKYRIHDNS